MARKRRLPIWGVVLIVVGALVTAGFVVDAVVFAALQPGKFEASLEDCGLQSNGFARLGDEGRTLNLNGGGGESGGLSTGQIACVLGELDVSDAVVAEMDSTRALDGRVTGSWGDVNAVWSYHPDNGLDIILTTK